MKNLNKIISSNILSVQKVILILLVILVYHNTLNNQFALDDTMMITSNDYTKGAWEGFVKIWTNDAFAGYLGEGKTLLPGGRYRPLSQAYFNVYYTLFGEKAFGLHLSNILLFLISAVLLFKNLRRIFKEKSKSILSIAFIASLLYVVHPLHTEVVANIKSMDYLFAVVFALLSLHYALSYTIHKKGVYLLAMSLALALSILSKETGLTFLAILPLSVYFVQKRNLEKNDIKIIALIFLPALLVVVAYFAIRTQIIGDTMDVVSKELLNNPFLEASNAEKYATLFYTWLIYLKLLIVPHPLTHDYYPYVIEITQWSNPLVLLSLLIIVLATVYALFNFTRSLLSKKQSFSIYAFGILFFLLVFSISSNLFVNIGAFMNERFMFIADVGLFIVFAGLLVQLKERVKSNVLPSILLVFIVLTFSILSYLRNPVWKNDYTLFRTDVKVSFNSAKCTVSAGGKTYDAALLEKNPTKRTNMLQESKKWVYQGVSIHPKYFQGWMLLGNIYFELNEFENAFTAYDNCLRLAGKRDGVLNNLRNLAIKSREEKNLAVSNKAIDLLIKYQYQPAKTGVLKVLNLELEGKIDEALQLSFQIIREDSANADIYNKLGQMIGQYKNDIELAEMYLLKAYELAPTNFSILENLGTLYAIQHEYPKALFFFKESIKSNPKNQQVYTNISNVYLALGKPEEAAEWLEKQKALVGK